jgi:predicted nucleic acid-binding protein
MARDLIRLPIEWLPSETFLAEALELAIVTSRTVYDCQYLALAIGHDCQFVTADRRLKNALAESPVGQRIRLVSEID